MSILERALQFVCDWCRLMSPGLPMPASGLYVDATPHLPDGWTSIGYGSLRGSPMAQVELKDVFGSQVSHLCPDCSAKPAGELLTWVAGASSRVPA